MSDHKELSYRHPAGRFAGCENRAGKGDLSGSLRRLIRIAVTPSLLALTILGMGLATAYASLPGTPYLSEDQLTSVAPAPSGGFWIQRQSENVCPPDCSTTPAGFTLQVDGAPIYDNIHHAGLIASVPRLWQPFQSESPLRVPRWSKTRHVFATFLHPPVHRNPIKRS